MPPSLPEWSRTSVTSRTETNKMDDDEEDGKR